MSTRSTFRHARSISLALALAAIGVITACSDSPTQPDRSAESMEARLDEGDTTDTGSDTTSRTCGHTQSWECDT